MSMFDEINYLDVIDCQIELHHLKEEAKALSTTYLVQHIVDFHIPLDLTKETESAIHNYFNTGELTKLERRVLEDCYVILKNDLCWGEPEYETAGVFRTEIDHR